MRPTICLFALIFIGLSPDLVSGDPVDVPPVGWRRTVRGWERTVEWPINDSKIQKRTINDLIRKQTAAEQGSLPGRGLSRALEFLRQVDPVTLACAQVTLLALYVFLVFHRESKANELLCPTQSKSTSMPSAG